MNCAREARKLADFITRLNQFQTLEVGNQFHYTHIGALVTDIILQAGLNYNTVVKPRVQNILINYSEYFTTTKFRELLTIKGPENVINWNHPVKLKRIDLFIDFCLANKIDTCSELKLFLCKSDNQQQLLKLNGIGPKTLDYLLKLLNFDTVAVDRHIYTFVELAEIDIKGYHLTKKVVEHAADFLNVSRASMDYSIWKYMSNKQAKNPSKNSQLLLKF